MPRKTATTTTTTNNELTTDEITLIAAKRMLDMALERMENAQAAFALASQKYREACDLNDATRRAKQ